MKETIHNTDTKWEDLWDEEDEEKHQNLMKLRYNQNGIAFTPQTYHIIFWIILCRLIMCNVAWCYVEFRYNWQLSNKLEK